MQTSILSIGNRIKYFIPFQHFWHEKRFFKRNCYFYDANATFAPPPLRFRFHRV